MPTASPSPAAMLDVDNRPFAIRTYAPDARQFALPWLGGVPALVISTEAGDQDKEAAKPATRRRAPARKTG